MRAPNWGGQAMPAKKRRNFLKKPGFDWLVPGNSPESQFQGPFCLKAVWDFIPVCHTHPLLTKKAGWLQRLFPKNIKQRPGSGESCMCV